MSIEQMIIDQLSAMTPGAKGIWLFGMLNTVALLGVGVKWSAEYRQLRKLPLEARQANREGFTAMVKLLQSQLTDAREELRRTREDLTRSYAEQEEYRKICHAENDQLRQAQIRQQGEIEGLHRKIADLTLRALSQGVDLSHPA